MKIPQARVGYNKTEDAREHDFFKDVCWQDVTKELIKPPFIPRKFKEPSTSSTINPQNEKMKYDPAFRFQYNYLDYVEQKRKFNEEKQLASERLKAIDKMNKKSVDVEQELEEVKREKNLLQEENEKLKFLLLESDIIKQDNGKLQAENEVLKALEREFEKIKQEIAKLQAENDELKTLVRDVKDNCATINKDKLDLLGQIESLKNTADSQIRSNEAPNAVVSAVVTMEDFDNSTPTVTTIAVSNNEEANDVDVQCVKKKILQFHQKVLKWGDIEPEVKLVHFEPHYRENYYKKVLVAKCIKCDKDITISVVPSRSGHYLRNTNTYLLHGQRMHHGEQ